MPGLIRAAARTAVIAGTATSVSNRVSRRQANRWAQQ
ncbi:MAG: SHOCT domain-containing protein, partial [Actinomycetota bacterium]|nr:SHOCT domain-containing protein [Actinomycetota bacterium]